MTLWLSVDMPFWLMYRAGSQVAGYGENQLTPAGWRNSCCSPRTLDQSCQTHFHRGPRQPRGCLQRAECRAPCPYLRSSYIYTVLKLHWAFSGWPRGWCDPRWRWVWHPCLGWSGTNPAWLLSFQRLSFPGPLWIWWNISGIYVLSWASGDK